jgi:hypothetical protein
MKAKELLTKSKNTPSVAFHKFVLLQKDHSKDLFCFFEGNDSDYYYSRIKQYFKGNHHPIICGNKSAVISVYMMIAEKYDHIKTAYFIDNDFDKRLNHERIYETPCYSVENFYTSRQVIIDILKNEFRLSEYDEEFNLAMEVFDEKQILYHKKSIFFNAWYAVLKEKGQKNGGITGVSLNHSIPKEFVLLRIGAISGEYNLEKIYKVYPEALVVQEAEILKKIEIFQKNELHRILRGKFELEFVHTFLQYLIEDANDKNKRTIMNCRTKFNIDKAQILSQLSQYAETPDCLIRYISSYN